MRFFGHFHRIIVRDLFKSPVRTVLTLAGVALGIAVVVAVQLANDRAVDSFSDSLAVLSGRADLQIEANGRPLDEALVGDLSWVWDVGAMTAVVEGRLQPAPLGQGPTFGQDAIRLFGVDLLSDAPFRTYELERSRSDGTGRTLSLELTRDQFVDLLTAPDAIVLPSVLAAEWRVGVGDVVDLTVASRRMRFRVHSILEDQGVARAFDGRIVFMDIAAAQWALNRTGEIDRIEIVLDDPDTLEAVEARIREQLPGSVVVFGPDDRSGETARMTRAFRYNLTALSYIAVLVGMILIYNTLSMAVVRRRSEIGTLRTLGVGRRTIAGMFLAEACLFGLVGAVLGIWIGEGLARIAGALVSGTIAMLYTGVSGSGTGGGWDPALYLQMMLLGVLLAAVSGTGPALRATAISPVNSLRPASTRPSNRRSVWVAGIGILIPAATLSLAPPIGGFPFLGYLSGVLFIAGFGLLTPSFARALVRYLEPVFKSIFPAEGRLAVETIRGNLSRVVIAVVSLSIAVAMLGSVAIMIASFRDTVVVWIDQTLKGDLYLRPATSGADGGRNTIPVEAIAALDQVPGIVAFDRFRGVTIDYSGFPAILAAGEFRTLSEHSRLLFLDGRATGDVASQLVGQSRVVVSEPFAVRHGIEAGETISLPTPGGLEPFEVVGVFFDYSTEGGMVVMDRSTYVERFNDDKVSNVAVYLGPGVQADVVRAEIADQIRESGIGVRIATNRELRAQVLRVFDQTFEVTYALEVIALAVALLGVTNTLATLIVERRQELAVLRFVGAERRQIRNVVMMESAVIGCLGGVIGLALGGVLSLLLVYVINFQSFGWTIQFTLPVTFLLQSFAVVLVATVIAGLYPAALALRLNPMEGVRAE